MPSKPTKVVFVSHQANRSGAPRSLINIIKYIDRQRFTPTVISFGSGPAIDEFSRMADTHVFQPNRPSFGSLLNRFRGRFENRLRKRWLLDLVHKISPDVIYYNTMANNSYVIWSAEMPLPKLMHFHEMGFLATMATSPEWFKALPGFVNMFIGCSQAVSDFIRKWVVIDSARIRTVYESLDIADLEAKPKRTVADIRWELGLPSNALVVGGVGIPHYLKGIDLFIESAGIVRQRDLKREIHFVWVGGGDTTHPFMLPMRRLADQLGVADRVHFVPPTTDILSYYQVFDVFAMSSREDSFPLTLLEAMFMGVPAVGFPIGGVPEALEQGGGLLLNGVSSEKLAQGILDIIENSDTKQVVKELAPTAVRQKYNAATNVRLIETAIQDVLLRA